MWHDVKLFMAERCPLTVLLPLAVVLYGAPALLYTPARLNVLAGGTTTLLGLLLIRIVDDLSDLDEDRRCHPRRGLVRGDIHPANLKKAAVLLGVMVLALNFVPPRSIYVGTVLGAYIVYYGLKGHLATIWQPAWVNLFFGAVPFYAAGMSAAVFYMALFVWLAVVGHDYCHSVHARGEGCHVRKTPSMYWSPRSAALVGVSAYALSAVAGACFWVSAGRPWLMAIALVLSVSGLAILGTALLINPCRARARAFYVPGFVFFALPLAAFIIQILIEI